jgi:hypothetical protein
MSPGEGEDRAFTPLPGITFDDDVKIATVREQIELSLPYRGYKMSCGHSLSRDSLTWKTTTAKAQIIKNSTQNRLFKINEPVPSGVAMSELSNGIKKHDTIPLKIKQVRFK